MDAQQPEAGQLAPNAPVKRVQLSEYWPQAPAAWFKATELKFQVAGITTEAEKFAHVAGALPVNLFQSVEDLVDNPPENVYTALRGRLVLAHELTPVQKATKLLQLPSLGNQRPSELMANLMQFCPPGETETAIFRASFISRLPPSLQIHLSGAEMGDLRELIQQADRLWLCHSPQPVAAVSVQQEEPEEAEETVAAVTWKGKGPPNKKGEGAPNQQSGQRGGWSGKRGGWSGQRGGQRGQRGGQQETNSSKWVCFKHSRFGSWAHFCEDEERCKYSGN